MVSVILPPYRFAGQATQLPRALGASHPARSPRETGQAFGPRGHAWECRRPVVGLCCVLVPFTAFTTFLEQILKNGLQNL